MKALPLAKHLPNVSRLAYGCMGLGGNWDDQPIDQGHVQQAHEVIDASLEAGINFFDHADIYTFGKAEQVFGKVFAQRPELREQIYLQSKCAIRFDDAAGPKRYDFSPEWIRQSVDGILARLGTDYLDVLLLHRPDPLMEPESVAEAFNVLQASGKVRHVGVSNMQAHQMAHLQHFLDQPLVANQIEISLQRHDWLDEGVTAGHPTSTGVGFSSGTLEYCQLNQVQIQSWGSLCQGLYSGRDVSQADAATQATAALVAELAAQYQVSNEAIVLAFLTRHPAAIQPVIGTTNVARIQACAAASELVLSREHWYALYVTARGAELP